MVATWCQREETPETPFSEAEKKELQFLYDEWAHPYFISIEEYERLMQVSPTPQLFCWLLESHLCMVVSCCQPFRSGLSLALIRVCR